MTYKSFVYLIGLLLCIFFTYAQADPEILTDNLFNRTELIRKEGISKEFIYVYQVKKEKLIDSGIAAMIFYDTLGNITKYERYDAPIVGLVRYDYTYNDRALVSKILVTRPKNQHSTINIMYDSAGNEIVRSTNNKFTSLIEWKEYDSLGRLVKQFDKFNSGKKYLAYINTWSKNNFLLSTQGFDEFGKHSYTETIKYSQDSLIVQKFFANKFFSKLESETTYNSNWQRVLIKRYQNDIQYHTDYNYAYNANGTIREWSARYKNKLVYIKRHFYYYVE